MSTLPHTLPPYLTPLLKVCFGPTPADDTPSAAARRLRAQGSAWGAALAGEIEGLGRAQGAEGALDKWFQVPPLPAPSCPVPPRTAPPCPFPPFPAPHCPAVPCPTPLSPDAIPHPHPCCR